MAFEPKLQQMCDHAEERGNADLETCLKRLSKLVASVLRDQRWNELTKADERALKDAIGPGQEAARRLDAALCVQDRVLLAENGKVLDVRLARGDLRAAQEQIYEAFATGEAPKRGFVYVAWRKTPERIIYVGKAMSASRLNSPSTASSHAQLLTQPCSRYSSRRRARRRFCLAWRRA